MRYVILRDDDTNAFTPVECLERLYRPFLDRGLPVNLSVIPDVSVNATTPDGEPEGFLAFKLETSGVQHSISNADGICRSGRPISGARSSAIDATSTVSIGSNAELADYLRQNPGYHIAQHGCHHDYFEFDRDSPGEISARLDRGRKALAEAGFPPPVAFVAPHDKFSRTSIRLAAERFRVISTGWFELRRLPAAWWPNYLGKKIRRAPHWRVGRTALLSHPGCRLSCHRNYDSMFAEVAREIESRQLTVLVTHWWEYFPGGKEDETFVRILHQLADYLAAGNEIKVISFAGVAPRH